MRGLNLSKQYYEFYGQPMIKKQFPEYEKRISCGLIGEGSECLGMDDEISRDHDWGLAFCMWLLDDDFLTIGQELANEYEKLPSTFLGYEKRIEGPMSIGRIGVMRISDFYYKYTGTRKGPATLAEWRRVPEHFFATATNGQVFQDDLGEFTKIRNGILNYYPEDIRLKKIAARCATMAQSGQYNYARAVKRGELVAAQLALSAFINASCSMVYLLNKHFMPFYKWAHRGMEHMTILPEVYGLLEKLCENPVDQKNVNVEIIEQICGCIISELHREELSDSQDKFLNDHWPSIISKIQDENLKNMHVFSE